ncbi:MAG: CDGSH iron-sulfur domain-containing protein [Corynebacterium sp.]|nr:CDGSH iron-sulfur domain-containing protein [Corynebacterium sp.]
MSDTSGMKITVTADGPFKVEGNVPLIRRSITPHEHGVEWSKGETLNTDETYYLCRCGESGNKPFCDGSHTAANFDGEEVASKVAYEERAELFEGPDGGVDLADDERCAFARFCHSYSGSEVWTLTSHSGDEHAKEAVKFHATQCPAGRLTPYEKDGLPIERDLEPAIYVTEDPTKGVSGSLAVEGGIPLEDAHGEPYEVRNRYTLCRCGGSENKPFCDATHVVKGFDDGHIDG